MISSKHIVITGGASGLGLELVRQLHNGNQISVIARPSHGLDMLRSDYPDLEVYEADLADLRSVEIAADQLIRSDRKIDILINNAAVQNTPRFIDPDFRYETIQREIDINFTSVCTLIYLLMPSLLQASPSMIVNINSGLALVPKTGSAVYCATKAALNIFSQSLRYQLEATNVQVKQVFIPLVDTAMTEGRGMGKMPVDVAAATVIKALSLPKADVDIGKIKALRVIHRFAPGLAAKIMKAG